MGARIGAGDGAEQLRRRPPLAHRRHGPAVPVRRLALQPRPVDRPSVEPRRGPGLEARKRKVERVELLRQRRRRPLPDPAAGAAGHAEMELAAEECAGGEDHRTGAERPPIAEHKAGDPTALEAQGSCFSLDDRQAGLRIDQVVDRLLVAAAVGLDARPAHGSALAGIEHPVMDRGMVGSAGNQPVKGIDLADQMALAKSAHRRIARHRADLLTVEADQGDRRTKPGRRGCRLGAGVTAAHHDDVEFAAHAAHLGACSTWNNGNHPGLRLTCRCRSARTARRACPRRRPGRSPGRARSAPGAGLPQR